MVHQNKTVQSSSLKNTPIQVQIKKVIALAWVAITDRQTWYQGKDWLPSK